MSWYPKKKAPGIFEALVQWCVKNITAPKSLGNFPLKYPRRNPFQVLTERPWSFPKSSLEQISCGELVSACFCKKELHSIPSLREKCPYSKFF